MLELRQDLAVMPQVNVMPQVVARACLLELSQEELEQTIQMKLDENPTLELVDVSATPWRRWGPDGDHPQPDLLTQLPAPVSLRDDLLWQLRAVSEGPQRRLAEYIVENLDSRGYLAVPVRELAQDLGVHQEEVEEALTLVQGLEPPGIGARNLAECLRLQVLAVPPSERPPGLLEYLETEFCQMVRQQLAGERTVAPRARERKYLEFIAANLYPYPADVYRPPFPHTDAELAARTPDVIIERVNGELRVVVPLSERIALRVDAVYEGLARSMDAKRDREGSLSIKHLVAEAREFIANLAFRHRTIARVAAAIVEAQREFFTHGPAALVPLTKKELAQRLGMHESTVCRATRGKTVMLPDGEILPFDVFFEDALPAKVALAQIVRREDPQRPLTDHELAEAMAARGYPVARRTVSKYRAALGIGTASERARTRTIAGGRSGTRIAG